jgi:hypothetical protein
MPVTPVSETPISPPTTNSKGGSLKVALRLLTQSLAVVFLGLGAFALIGFPLWVGLIGYEWAKHRGVSQPVFWAQLVGCGSLFLIPMIMLGNALRLSAFRSASSVEAPSAGNKVLTSDIVEIWKTTVDVQRHFNELELQIRNFAVTLLAAVIGATAFAYKEHYTIAIRSTTFSVAVPVLCAGIVGWLAFYFMDRFWYHNLLLASVVHSGKIEKEFESPAAELGLSRAISKGSSWKVWFFEIHTSQKIDLFYATGLTVMIVMTMGALLATSVVMAK